MPYYRLFYHFIWTTKVRLPLITESNQALIYATIRAKVDDLNGIVHALNGMADHLHLVATVPPSLSLADLIRQVKGSSSHAVSYHTNSPEPFGWQTDYGVVSVSESHAPIVIRYVENQQKHHADKSLNATLENASGA